MRQKLSHRHRNSIPLCLLLLALFAGAVCDPISIFGGGCTVHTSKDYNIIGPNCVPKPQCVSSLQSARVQAAAPAPAYAEPAIATDGLGNTFALWRTASNRLAFNCYQNGTWSAPGSIATGLGAFSPKIAFVAPNRAVAVWVESGLNAAQAGNATFEGAIKSQRIAYALWDGSACSPAKVLAASGLGEGRVALTDCHQGAPLCPAGGEATAVWERNVSLDFSARQIRLFYARYRDGAWSGAAPIDANAPTLAPTDTQARQGAPFVAWVRDADQKLATWDGGPGVGQEAGRTQLIALAAGQPTNVTLNLASPATLDRPHTLVVTVNPQQRIAEPNALDNQQSVQIGGIPSPVGLQVTSRRGIAKALLRWDAPQDPRVVGYRIYRVDGSGAQTPVGSSFVTSFVDRNVQIDRPTATSSPPTPLTASSPGRARPRRSRSAKFGGSCHSWLDT
jgi:hypothetical protein